MMQFEEILPTAVAWPLWVPWLQKRQILITTKPHRELYSSYIATPNHLTNISLISKITLSSSLASFLVRVLYSTWRSKRKKCHAKIEVRKAMSQRETALDAGGWSIAAVKGAGGTCVLVCDQRNMVPDQWCLILICARWRPSVPELHEGDHST